MKKDYCIWIVSPPGYIHSRCFEEVALGLQAAFQEIGYPCPVITQPNPIFALTVILGGHLIQNDIPSGSIIFNLEQINESLNPHYFEMLKKNEVWDYSQSNIDTLAKLGIEAKLCGIGYVPALTRIPQQKHEIDVLFFGSLNERRQQLLTELKKTGIEVVSLFGIYGPERDAYIARAKIVLNVHFYESKVFEIVRCSYLLANKKCVVSEIGSDMGLEAPFRQAIAFDHYDSLMDTCLHYLRHKEERERLARHGFEIFSGMSQAEMLRKVL